LKVSRSLASGHAWVRSQSGASPASATSMKAPIVSSQRGSPGSPLTRTIGTIPTSTQM
jgi:hypothetical protein